MGVMVAAAAIGFIAAALLLALFSQSYCIYAPRPPWTKWLMAAMAVFGMVVEIGAISHGL